MIPKHAQEVINEINNLQYNPKGKDKDLIESVKRCIEINKVLSKKQAKWLNDIYAKATGGGVYQNKSYV